MNSNLKEGLEILAKYGDSALLTEGTVTHAGPALNVSNPITEEDEEKLRNLGWQIGDKDKWMFAE